MIDDITGHLILVMAPSGSGKGLLTAHIRKTEPDVYFAVSLTTRPPRPNEKDNEVYHFVSDEEFDRSIQEGIFLEWAEFSGHRYGTLRSEIVEPLQKGCVVLREVEPQGILAIQKCIPKERMTVVYIDAGPCETLERRIIRRAPISPEHLTLRHQRYIEESKWKAFADVIIKNDEGHLAQAKTALREIVRECVRAHT